MEPRPPPVFEKAQILCYRVFDVAEEIDLERARALVTEESRRLKLGREGSQYLELPNPPLAVDMGKRVLPLRAGALSVDAEVRVYDHGAMSVQLKVPIPPGTTLTGLVPLADELYDTPAVEALCAEIAKGLRSTMAPAMLDAHFWDQNESYTVIFAERLSGNSSPEDLLEHPELTNLLLGEAHGARLSRREREEVTQHRFSYTDQDLVVVDWNSAFVLEPSGSLDIPDILEICNAQLLELRYYDDLLDEQLKRIYDEIQAKKARRYGLFRRSPYKALARRVLAMVLEMSEFIERVENSLKVIGDFYLAKVYEGALGRLRINAWQESVTRKQQLLGNVYQLLKDEVEHERSFTLEVTIAILIVGELLLAVLSVLGQVGGH
ncbi:MAG TPA: hypothetical protein VFA20_12890 [Myxococcaceae bacterium]|nr:hypothetical protein [Myxococcaceae bacterium]